MIDLAAGTSAAHNIGGNNNRNGVSGSGSGNNNNNGSGRPIRRARRHRRDDTGPQSNANNAADS